MPNEEGLHRREFARSCLGGLGAASLAAPGMLLAAEDGKEPAKPPAELLLLSVLLQRYPDDHYSEEIVAGIYRDIAADLARGKQLRAFALRNADEPAVTFRAVRAAAAGKGAP